MGMKSERETNTSCIDCNMGRYLGCGTFCCLLIVRLQGNEAERFYPDIPNKRFVEKDEDGYCEFLDRKNFECTIWDKRPQVCREYNCNDDYLLQVAVKRSYSSITELVKLALKTLIYKETYIKIPPVDTNNDEDVDNDNNEVHKLINQ